MRATTVCGQRLPRANPCWVEESGNVSCLPAVYLLGEMRCGTTSLYARLLSHPDVEAPLNKEPRYLTLPNYRYHTGSSYAANFAPVARQDARAITLDASPTVFNAPLLAPLWVKKWVPEAKHLVLLRDPIQRTYSHWRAGVDWLKDSSCFVAPAMPANASLARATGFFKPQPLPEIRMMREVFSFDAQARLGLVEVALRECGASLGWGQYGGDEVTLSNETKACILSTSLGEDVAALFRTRQALAGRRTDAERDAYAEGMRRVSACSQYMLVPGAGVWRSSRYASNLAAWYAAFPRSQIKVLATEELERDATAVMKDVISFLGLREMELPKPKHDRLCVVGKAASSATDPPDVASPVREWRAGRLDGSSDEGGDDGDDGDDILGPCAARREGEVIKGKDGVSRYKMTDETAALLHRYFLPFNQKLFDLLGRRLPWGEPL